MVHIANLPARTWLAHMFLPAVGWRAFRSSPTVMPRQIRQMQPHTVQHNETWHGSHYITRIRTGCEYFNTAMFFRYTFTGISFTELQTHICHYNTAALCARHKNFTNFEYVVISHHSLFCFLFFKLPSNNHPAQLLDLTYAVLVFSNFLLLLLLINVFFWSNG